METSNWCSWLSWCLASDSKAPGIGCGARTLYLCADAVRRLTSTAAGPGGRRGHPASDHLYLYIGPPSVYTTYLPAPELRPYVKCYWFLRSDRNRFHPAKPLIPDGCMELIINFGDPYLRY